MNIYVFFVYKVIKLMCPCRTLYVVFNEHTQTGIAGHNSTATVSSVGHSGAAGLALWIFYVKHSAGVALYVTLFGGLSDAEDNLPPPPQQFREMDASVHSYSISIFGQLP